MDTSSFAGDVAQGLASGFQKGGCETDRIVSTGRTGKFDVVINGRLAEVIVNEVRHTFMPPQGVGDRSTAPCTRCGRGKDSPAHSRMS